MSHRIIVIILIKNNRIIRMIRLAVTIIRIIIKRRMGIKITIFYY